MSDDEHDTYLNTPAHDTDERELLVEALEASPLVESAEILFDRTTIAVDFANEATEESFSAAEYLLEKKASSVA